MKKVYFFLLLFCFGLNSYSQQLIVTICSEKTGCQFAEVTLSKAQIDNILDKPNFLAKEKTAIILNLTNCVSTIEKNTTPQLLHQKFGGKGTISQIKNFDLRKYIIDNACLSNCNSPLTPNAGQQANIKIGLNGNFTFTTKFTFSMQSSEGNYTTHFYFNTNNGYSLMDNEAMKKITSENYGGEFDQIMTSYADFYQYTKSPEGNFSMKLGAKTDDILASTKKSSIDFFKKFKKTGARKRMYGDSDSEEYNGIDEEGNESSIWLSCSGSISVDKKVTYALTGFSGLGYVVNPAGETFLVTAIEGSGVQIKLINIEKQNASFSGKMYTPMGDMMGQAISQNQQEMNESTENENQYGQAMLEQMVMQNKKFTETSDLQDLASTELPKSEEFTSNQYNYLILGLEQSVKDIQKEIAELNKSQSDYKKRLSDLNCAKNCTLSEKARYEKLKSEHLALLIQYKDDDEKRNEKVGSLLQDFHTTLPCNCN
jgi:hypothetical protein